MFILKTVSRRHKAVQCPPDKKVPSCDHFQPSLKIPGSSLDTDWKKTDYRPIHITRDPFRTSDYKNERETENKIFGWLRTLNGSFVTWIGPYSQISALVKKLVRSSGPFLRSVFLKEPFLINGFFKCPWSVFISVTHFIFSSSTG